VTGDEAVLGGREVPDREAGNASPGWPLLLDGEEEIPFPKASTATMKYFELSAMFPGPMYPSAARSPLVPDSQVANRTALDFSAFRTPNVR
jgi:hypothetical protein